MIDRERAKLTLRIAAIVFVLVGYATYPQRNQSQPVPQFVYGQWTITKFVEVGGHAAETKERAQGQIGKTLRIAFQSFRHDSKFLWFDDTCKNASYRMKETDSEKGSLGFYGLEQEESGQFLIVTCNKRDSYSLEVAKNQELAVYYDGWFFFLRKTKGTSD
jgi:hypothetical protein